MIESQTTDTQHKPGWDSMECGWIMYVNVCKLCMYYGYNYQIIPATCTLLLRADSRSAPSPWESLILGLHPANESLSLAGHKPRISPTTHCSQVMPYGNTELAWSHQATRHYLRQSWRWSVSTYSVTRPQWVKYPLHQHIDSDLVPFVWEFPLCSVW